MNAQEKHVSVDVAAGTGGNLLTCLIGLEPSVSVQSPSV